MNDQRTQAIRSGRRNSLGNFKLSFVEETGEWGMPLSFFLFPLSPDHGPSEASNIKTRLQNLDWLHSFFGRRQHSNHFGSDLFSRRNSPGLYFKALGEGFLESENKSESLNLLDSKK